MCQIADARELAEQDCYNYDRLITLRDVSLFMVVAALLMIAAISVAARFAERDRRLLAALFIPGVHLTLFALLVMIVAQSLIAAYAFYTVETELARSVGVALIYCLILSAVLGAWGTVRVGFAVSRRPPLVVLGIEINQETQGRLWRFVAQVASKLGAEPPAHIVLGLQPTFYATPANLVLVGQSQVLTGDTIHLSLPMLRILSEQELAAVVGHEIGHFKEEDAICTLHFLIAYSSVSNVLGRISTRPYHSLALIPAAVVLDYLLERFAAAERTIGRQREVEADFAGVLVGGAEPLAAAIVKITMFTRLWTKMLDMAVAALDEGRAIANISLVFSKRAAIMLGHIDWSHAVSELSASDLDHAMGIHPSLTDRVATLGLTLPRVCQGLQVDAQHSAATLLGGIEAIEEALTMRQINLLSRLRGVKL
jgi:Zn-dependent protease with chaperone function